MYSWDECVKFKEGAMWDEPAWTIAYDKECYSSRGGPCKHCKEVRKLENSTVVVWTCPRVAIGFNESGYCSTGLCVDCIIEKAKEKDEHGPA